MREKNNISKNSSPLLIAMPFIAVFLLVVFFSYSFTTKGTYSLFDNEVDCNNYPVATSKQNQCDNGYSPVAGGGCCPNGTTLDPALGCINSNKEVVAGVTKSKLSCASNQTEVSGQCCPSGYSKIDNGHCIFMGQKCGSSSSGGGSSTSGSGSGSTCNSSAKKYSAQSICISQARGECGINNYNGCDSPTNGCYTYSCTSSGGTTQTQSCYYNSSTKVCSLYTTTPGSPWIKDTGTYCDSSCNLKSSSSGNTTYTVIFDSNGGTGGGTKTCTSTNGVNCSVTAPIGGSKSGYNFNGWGTSASCENGTFFANQPVTVNSNSTYYACWKKDASSLNCTYGSSITRNSSYLTVSVNPANSTCCVGTGWSLNGTNCTTAISSFIDPRDGKEYLRHLPFRGMCYDQYKLISGWCIEERCNCDDGGCLGGGSGTNPSSGTTPTTNPNPSTNSTYACYLVNHKYVWASSKPSGGTLVTTKTSSSACSGCESGYTKDSKDNCVIPSTGSSTNVTENPKTGTLAIAIAWFAGLLALICSYFYFKRNITE